MEKGNEIKKASLGVVVLILIGALFYFRIFSSRKKVQLDLLQKQEQEAARNDNADQVEITDNVDPLSPASSAEDLRGGVAEDSGASSQPDEISKNAANSDSPTSSNDAETSKTTKLSITNRLVSWGFQKSSGRKIDTIIIHSSYDALGSDPYSVSGVIAEYKSYGVSPHYLIDRKGQVSRLVVDQNIAYHAGDSTMPDGRTGVNNFSIGIEMLTTKKDKLTQEQYDALKLLIVDLKGKYGITAVLGHNQIAPERKDDPWNFEWNKLK